MSSRCPSGAAPLSSALSQSTAASAKRSSGESSRNACSWMASTLVISEVYACPAGRQPQPKLQAEALRELVGYLVGGPPELRVRVQVGAVGRSACRRVAREHAAHVVADAHGCGSRDPGVPGVVEGPAGCRPGLGPDALPRLLEPVGVTRATEPLAVEAAREDVLRHVGQALNELLGARRKDRGSVAGLRLPEIE